MVAPTGLIRKTYRIRILNRQMLRETKKPRLRARLSNFDN